MSVIGKYFGSKQRVAKHLVSGVLEYCRKHNLQYDRIIEPFCGSGATLIQFRQRVNCPVIGTDREKCVICTLQSVQMGYVPPSSVTERQFIDLKNDETNPLKAIVHIGASFMGQLGHHGFRNPGTCENLAKIARYIPLRRHLLQGIEFRVADYLDLECKGCLVLCDPPYLSAKKNWPKNYRGFDHEVFWKWAEHMSLENIVIVSEYEAPENWRCIWRHVIRTANTFKLNKVKVEKLFVLRK